MISARRIPTGSGSSTTARPSSISQSSAITACDACSADVNASGSVFAAYEGALERLGKQIAERDRDNLRWQAGLWVAAVVILGWLVHWP